MGEVTHEDMPCFLGRERLSNVGPMEALELPDQHSRKPTNRAVASCFRPRIFCKEGCPAHCEVSEHSTPSAHQRPAAPHNRGNLRCHQTLSTVSWRTSPILLRSSVLKGTSLRWVGLWGWGQSEPSFARQEPANLPSLSSHLTPAIPRAQKDAVSPAIYCRFSKIPRKAGRRKTKPEKGRPTLGQDLPGLAKGTSCQDVDLIRGLISQPDLVVQTFNPGRGRSL